MHAPRTNKSGISAVVMALIFCFSTYTLFSLMAMFSYGIDIQPNIFENIKQDKGAISICLRALFMLIFVCNIPFTFIAGKECLLTFILEYRERVISNQLARQLHMSLQHADHSVSSQLHPVQISFSKIDRQVGKPTISEIVDKRTYYIVVFSLFTAQSLLAIFIDDLTLVINTFNLNNWL